MRTIVGLFDSHHNASRALAGLQKIGVPAKDISCISSEKRLPEQDRAKEYNVDPAYPPGKGPAAPGDKNGYTGIAAGTVIGAAAGLALVSVVIPGLGVFLAAGPLLATAGALAGGLAGFLASMGVPEKEASVLQKKVAGGSTLISAPLAKTSEKEALKILKGSGALKAKIYEV